MTPTEEARLDAYEIDIRFLNDKYGFDRKLAGELIRDILKGNFESKENK